MITSSTIGGDLRVRIRHREYVADITGSVLFVIQQYNINPGLALLFPWLSQLAILFESYLVNGLKFQFRTEAPTSQAGKAMLAVDWDVLDAVPASKTALMQERTKADSPVWVDLDLNCDIADLRKFGTQRFVRNGTAPSGSDLKTYDVGMLSVATQGVTGAPVIGELWVEYDIELITPNTAPFPSSAKVVGGGTVTQAAPFGSVPAITGTLPVSATGTTITFNSVGQYLFEYALTGTVITAISGAGSTATVAVAAAIIPSATGLTAVGSMTINVMAPGQTLIFGVTATTITASTSRISQYATALL